MFLRQERAEMDDSKRTMLIKRVHQLWILQNTMTHKQREFMDV